MRMTGGLDATVASGRRTAVAGSFYPADADELAGLVDDLLAAARPADDAVAATATGLAGVLVPHAGLVYSGHVAAVAWRLVTNTAPATIVMLGTNHRAGWLRGVAVWDADAWRTPLGAVEVDADLAAEIVALGPPFMADRAAHRSEHSIEVQLPFVRRALPGTRIVPLAISAGRGESAVRAGARLGALLAERQAAGGRVCLAISTDMAHYPPATVAALVTEELAPVILGSDAAELARQEAKISDAGLPGVVCGMCGIEPTVLGLAALRAMGVKHGVRLAAATSADAGGPREHTVGYFAAAFPD